MRSCGTLFTKTNIVKNEYLERGFIFIVQNILQPFPQSFSSGCETDLKAFVTK